MQRLMKDVQASNLSWENMGTTGIDGPQSPAVALQGLFAYCSPWSKQVVNNPSIRKDLSTHSPGSTVHKVKRCPVLLGPS